MVPHQFRINGISSIKVLIEDCFKSVEKEQIDIAGFHAYNPPNTIIQTGMHAKGTQMHRQTMPQVLTGQT